MIATRVPVQLNLFEKNGYQKTADPACPLERLVTPVSRAECAPFILKIHYAKRWPSVSYRFGLFVKGELVGIVTFGTPPSWTLCAGICGKEYQGNVLELNRLCLSTNRPNEASFLVGNAMKLLPKEIIVVSFADTRQGHCGFVYQATNFLYTGLSKKFLDPRVVGFEHQHYATYAHGLTNKQVEAKFGKENVYYEQRTRKHRYITFIGNKRFKKKARKALLYPVLDYPKA